jgi:hypothetical protein
MQCKSEGKQKKKDFGYNAELLLLVMHLAVLVDINMPEHVKAVVN